MKQWKERFVLGITGGMGSGKSTINKFMEEFGAIPINSDEIAKFYTSNESPIKSEIIALLGNEIIDSQGNFDRKKIASIVFTDKEKLNSLNSLIHPRVRKKIIDQIQSIKNGKIVVWESAILFETKGNTLCDSVLTVSIDLENAYERVLKRDNISREEFLNRIGNQADINSKIEFSNFHIINKGELALLKNECNNIFNQILNHRIK